MTDIQKFTVEIHINKKYACFYTMKSEDVIHLHSISCACMHDGNIRASDLLSSTLRESKMRKVEVITNKFKGKSSADTA